MTHPAQTTGMTSWELHLQTLHKQFYEQAHDQCVLWVNPAQFDLFSENDLVQERKVRVPISHPRFDQQFAPYLVLLNVAKSPDADVFKTSVQAAWEAWNINSLQAFQGQPICGWIMTDTMPAELARYWGASCHLHQQSGLTKLLRFHDPSVREWLWPSLSPEQQHTLMGPANTVWAFNRQLALMRHDTPTDIQQNSTSTETPRLTLNAKQWVQIDDYAALHAAWLELSQIDSDRRQALDKNLGWAQQTLAAMEEASGYGISNATDRQIYALHALRLGSNFHLHPQFRAVWQKTLAGDFYGGAVEEVFKVGAFELTTASLKQ